MPASWRTSDVAILVIAGAGIILLTAASFVVAPTDAGPQNDGSSYSAHADGGRAAYLLLQQLGYSVERSFEPLAAIRYSAPESTTIVLAEPSIPPSDQDVRALRQFVESGGLVLVSGTEASIFLPGTPSRPAGRQAPARSHAAALPSPLSAGVASVEMPHAGSAVPQDSPYVPVFGTYEQSAVLTATFDRGRAVWMAASTPLVNAGIGKPGHAELFVNVLGPPGVRTVIWDEFYHGHQRSVWSYLSATPLPFAMLQLGVLVALGLFTFSRRRTPIRPLVVEPRTSPLEFIDTMGGLYRRAGAQHAAVATVRERVRRRVLDALGLPPATTDERLMAAAAERLSLDPDEIGVFERARIAAEDPALSDSTAVAIVSDLQRVAARAHDFQRQRQRKP